MSQNYEARILTASYIMQSSIELWQAGQYLLAFLALIKEYRLTWFEKGRTDLGYCDKREVADETIWKNMSNLSFVLDTRTGGIISESTMMEAKHVLIQSKRHWGGK
jgi:hypothetical protein